MSRPGWAYGFFALLFVLGLASCSEEEPIEPSASPADLELGDLLGVWHCVECSDAGQPNVTGQEDSTLFLSVLPDSVLVLYCRGDSLDWWDFRADPDTMWITARGPLSNNADITISWTAIDSTDSHRVVFSVFGFPVQEDIRRKIPQEPVCP